MMFEHPSPTVIRIDAVSWIASKNLPIWMMYVENLPDGLLFEPPLFVRTLYTCSVEPGGFENTTNIMCGSLGEQLNWPDIDEAQAAFVCSGTVYTRVPVSHPSLLLHFGSVRALLIAGPNQFHSAETGSPQRNLFSQWEGFLKEQQRQWKVTTR